MIFNLSLVVSKTCFTEAMFCNADILEADSLIIMLSNKFILVYNYDTPVYTYTESALGILTIND